MHYCAEWPSIWRRCLAVAVHHVLHDKTEWKPVSPSFLLLPLKHVLLNTFRVTTQLKTEKHEKQWSVQTAFRHHDKQGKMPPLFFKWMHCPRKNKCTYASVSVCPVGEGIWVQEVLLHVQKTPRVMWEWFHHIWRSALSYCTGVLKTAVSEPHLVLLQQCGIHFTATSSCTAVLMSEKTGILEVEAQ